MFDNVGGKIKSLAKVFCWLGIFVSIIVGIAMILISMNSYNGEIFSLIGVVIIILGSILSWIGSLLIYGFGELVQNSCIQTEIAVKKSMQEDYD